MHLKFPPLYNGNNFCDFLFAFPHTLIPSEKRVYSKKKESFLFEWTRFQKEENVLRVASG